MNLYKNLQHIATDKYRPGKIHPLLSISCNSSRDVNRVPTKLRTLTGTYILQSNRASFKNGENNSICLLCGSNDETLEHFILYCPTLSNIRDTVINEIIEILNLQFNIRFNDLLDSEKLDIILDCSYIVNTFADIANLAKLEFQTRHLLHNLHSARHRMISNLK